jgi:hypothetical protein
MIMKDCISAAGEAAVGLEKVREKPMFWLLTHLRATREEPDGQERQKEGVLAQVAQLESQEMHCPVGRPLTSGMK